MRRALVDVTRERVRAGTRCLNLQRVAERLRQQAATVRAEGRAAKPITASQLEAIARDVGEAAEAERDLHARLKSEELALRQSEIPLGA